MKDEEGKEQLLCNWIPKQMNEIFSHLEVSINEVHIDGDLKTIDLKVLYKGKPARNYDYTYFDGRDWSNIFRQKTDWASSKCRPLPMPKECRSKQNTCSKANRTSTMNWQK